MLSEVAHRDDEHLHTAPAVDGARRVQAQQKGMSVVGLFAGIGGMELGLEMAGHHTLMLCEIMPEARAVLAAAASGDHPAFRDADHALDVTCDLEPKLPTQFDILAAGFPCQDLSQAGRTAGIGGSRSGLIEDVIRILGRRPATRLPTWIILENVPFMRHLANGSAMDVVLRGLSALGYSWAYREVDALAFGLPQRRRRLFIVACLYERGDPRRVLLDGDEKPEATSHAPEWGDDKACGFYWTEGNRGVGWASDAVPTLKGGSGLGIPSPPAIILPGGKLVVPTIRDAESLQGFPRGWTEPAIEVDPKGGRIRWQLVGNAISVPVAEWIGRRLEGARVTLERQDPRLEVGDRWPSAAWQMDPSGPRHVAMVGTWPVHRPRKPLRALLDEEAGDRPPLSRKAAAGFLKRFEASNLLGHHETLRLALLDVLHRHVENSTAK